MAQRNPLKHPLLYLLLLFFLTGCGSKEEKNDSGIISMQMIDRNGFSETISTKERLASFSKVDFMSPQPYKKVLRVFPRNEQGQTVSRITSYHPNGQICQYLEVVEGRAHGVYQEWHLNGKKKIEAYVIEGLADVIESAQASWLFDGVSKVWDDKERIVAEFFYEKGSLHGDSKYFHENGFLHRSVPYQHNEIDGVVNIYSPEGEVLEKIPFSKDLKEGHAEGRSSDGQWTYSEHYSQGKLLEATYTSSSWEQLPKVVDGEGFQISFEGERIASIIEIHHGIALGSVRIFNNDGSIASLFHIKDAIKSGEELLFYPSAKAADPLKLPRDARLSIPWQDDAIHGITKSWYENGVLESQREINRNKKHGLCLAYFSDGTLMLMEEYDQDRLTKGTYYRRGDKQPTSKVADGAGMATLFDGDGKFKQKIHYEKGWPKIGNE